MHVVADEAFSAHLDRKPKKRRGRASIQSLYFFERTFTHSSIICGRDKRVTELRPKTHHRRGKKTEKATEQRERIRRARQLCQNRLHFSICATKSWMQECSPKACRIPRWRGGHTTGGLQREAVHVERAWGAQGAGTLICQKRKRGQKKAQDFILFWRGQNRPNPESRDERPPGNHQGREGNWSKGIRKIKIFLYGERSPRGTIIFDTKCETEKNNFFLFGHKGKKRPGKGINIGPELCPREGYHISGNNNLTKERE